MEISIATLNVHMWLDGDWSPNYGRILKLVKVGIDIQRSYPFCAMSSSNLYTHDF